MREPPRVTIVDPSHPGPQPPDELGEDGAPSRRGLYAGLLVLVLLLGWRGVEAVLDRRAAAAEERRLSAIVELELTARFAGGSESRDVADVAEIVREVGLRNTGPRAVEILSASLGSLTLQGSERLEPRRDTPLRLVRRLSCAQRPPEERAERSVRISVRNANGDVVERRLFPPPDSFILDSEVLRRACGYVEPHEAGTVIPTGSVRLQDGGLLVDLTVGNSGRNPVLLARLGGGSGMTASLYSADDRPADLPLEVPPGAGSRELPPLLVTVRLAVEDCADVVRPDYSDDLFDQASAAVVVTAFAAPGSEPAPGTESFSGLEQLQAVSDLLDQSCG